MSRFILWNELNTSTHFSIFIFVHSLSTLLLKTADKAAADCNDMVLQLNCAVLKYVLIIVHWTRTIPEILYESC